MRWVFAAGALCIVFWSAVAYVVVDVANGRGANSTSYCLTGRMADGTFTRARSAASNRHPLGTKIRITGSQSGPRGMRRYVIRDRIGHGSELDLWTSSCGDAIRYGRRSVSYKIGWAKP